MKSKKNSEKVINWLKENQNKPVNIGIHAYELGTYLTFLHGFTVIDDSGEIELNENNGENCLALLDLIDTPIDFRKSGDFMNVFGNGDMEYSTKHFSIGFELI